MGDFRKNILSFRGEKIIARKYLGKKYPTLKKKNVTPLHVREKSITRGLGK